MKQLFAILFLFSLVACSSERNYNCSVDTVAFFGAYDLDSIRLTCGNESFVFASKETVFDTISGFNISAKHESINPYCTKIKTITQESFLLVMERPDFAGPVIGIFDINQSEPIRTLTVQGEPVEIFYQGNNTFVAIQEIQSEPGSQEGYEVTSIPLFNLFRLEAGQIELDKKATEEYNLKNFADYELISKMKNPVYGYKDGKRSIIESKK